MSGHFFLFCLCIFLYLTDIIGRILPYFWQTYPLQTVYSTHMNHAVLEHILVGYGGYYISFGPNVPANNQGPVMNTTQPTTGCPRNTGTTKTNICLFVLYIFGTWKALAVSKEYLDFSMTNRVLVTGCPKSFEKCQNKLFFVNFVSIHI